MKVKAKMTGNRAVASVYIDVDAMDNYYNAAGYQVASWANQGLHGGMETGHKPHVRNIEVVYMDSELFRVLFTMQKL